MVEVQKVLDMMEGQDISAAGWLLSQDPLPKNVYLQPITNNHNILFHLRFE